MMTKDGRKASRGKGNQRDLMAVVPWVVAAATLLTPALIRSQSGDKSIRMASITDWFGRPIAEGASRHGTESDANAEPSQPIPPETLSTRNNATTSPGLWQEPLLAPRRDAKATEAASADVSSDALATNLPRRNEVSTVRQVEPQSEPPADPQSEPADDPVEASTESPSETPDDTPAGGTGDEDAPAIQSAPRSNSPISVVIQDDLPATLEVATAATGTRNLNMQMTSAMPASFEATVSDSMDDMEEIRVIKDRTLIIKTSVPIARVSVVNPEIAEVNAITGHEIEVKGLEYGATQLILWTPDQQRKTFEVSVEIDIQMLARAIKQLSPLSEVQGRMLAGTLVLSGRAPDVATADRIQALARVIHPRILNHIDVSGTHQVLLRCTVAEVNREAIRELAMNWAIGGSDLSRDFFFANNLNQLNPTIFGDNGLTNVLAANPVGQLLYNRAPTVNGSGVNVTFGFPRAEFQLFVRALRDNNLLQVLAEPNVVAVNGQEASFLAGGEFPIAVAQGGSSAGAVSVEFKRFGIQLNFVPTLLENGMIRMKLIAEVSDLVPGSAGTAGGLPVFSLSSRRVESTVDAGDGQTIAIGGLLSETVQAASSKIPGLGDVPVLGTLFSSVRYQRKETELVVLVTPEMAAPLDPHQVGIVPGGDIVPPDDGELFFLQQLEGKPAGPENNGGSPRHTFPPRVRPNMPADNEDLIELSVRGPWGASDFEGQ